MKKGNSILSDHTRIGTRFVPKGLDGKIIETSYINLIVPEIIWMGLINDTLGIKQGIKAIEGLIDATAQVLGGISRNFSLSSQYLFLDAKEKEKIHSTLNILDNLETLQTCLAPLICLYDDFPLAFIGQPMKPASHKALISSLKRCLRDHLDKHNYNAVISQANVTYINIRSGLMKFANGTKPPNLNILFDSPDSEEAKHVAGLVRAGIMAQFFHFRSENNSPWPQSFWNQSYMLDNCQYMEEQDDNNP